MNVNIKIILTAPYKETLRLDNENACGSENRFPLAERTVSRGGASNYYLILTMPPEIPY